MLGEIFKIGKNLLYCDAENFPECGMNCGCVTAKKKELARIKAQEEAKGSASLTGASIDFTNPTTIALVAGGTILLLLLLKN